MAGMTFGKTRAGLLAAVSIAALGLTACDENGEFSFGAGANRDAGESAAAGQAVQLVERDVEAPDVFQVTDSGLWDGRPSLGGVWVAHPDVSDPERVIIRNTENGKFVIGALFRREREQPGPALQVSSDAAAALEMLAGAPASLNVTALRREEVPAEAPPAAIADFDEPAEIEATTLDPIANAAAAIDAAEGATETAVAATPPAPRPTAPASSLEKPFIQIGIFSVKANADRAADMMRATGIVPTVLEQSSQGRTFWRVIVGPAGTTADRAALLEQVKGQGFTDAYFVTN
ncbi:SPOR domain-containing protein [Marivivens marinus]|uniref:SPOR domain-containing protein n=1 Tax=Marivivens marinus TaxID=3110173 RepID=UPI003B846602